MGSTAIGSEELYGLIPYELRSTLHCTLRDLLRWGVPRMGYDASSSCMLMMSMHEDDA